MLFLWLNLFEAHNPKHCFMLTLPSLSFSVSSYFSVSVSSMRNANCHETWHHHIWFWLWQNSRSQVAIKTKKLRLTTENEKSHTLIKAKRNCVRHLCLQLTLFHYVPMCRLFTSVKMEKHLAQIEKHTPFHRAWIDGDRFKLATIFECFVWGRHLSDTQLY